ncbi:aldehyde reductase, putative [Plasmodium gallinaceum]|uniref:Aldehyde reductase, putative n=1 Tax=Plasmodium gallinaceum TaxID=5849 RepID=A0A1J1GNY5_PLAGA|nr:aldehyde reductase, putative [Plasmodium gallinaceum]CRG94004.1 aldehyde reductase, putative [Plasmodium gallinaceum]
MDILFLLLFFFFIEINCKNFNLISLKNILYINNTDNKKILKLYKLNYGRKKFTFVCKNDKKLKKKKKIKYFIKSSVINKKYSIMRKIKTLIYTKKDEDYNDTYNSINKDKNLSEEYEKNNLIKNDKDFIDQIKKNMNPNDEVTYKYVEDMELKKINIRGVDIEYRIYNLEEGIYIVDEENYEKIKKLWNEEELKKAKENFEESFDIKNQGIKDNEWIMFPLDYEENKNIKLIKADFDNPTYDYILTYYDKERDYYWKYKRRNFYKMFRNTIHEKPPYKSELEKDKRFYGKEIIIPKKELDNKIFRQPMLSDVLTDGYSKEPIGLESWRFVKYPYGNLIEHQKYSQLYCVKKNNNDKPDMRYYYLGNSNLAVSEICIGTMNFGNYVNEKLAHELFDYAYEEFQVNFFDTAEIYPLPVNENLYGLSEEILGNWLESKGKANRHKFVISTKICGRTNKIPWLKKYKTKKLEEKKREEEIKKKSEQSLLSSNGENNFNSNGPEKLYKLKKKEELYLKKDYEMINKLEEIEKYNDDNNLITLTKENIISSVDDSLKRLKTNYIDLLQLHWPDRYYPNQSSGDYSDVLFDYNKYYDDFVPFIEQLQAIDELKKKGKIREWGLSNETPFGLLKFYELCKNLHISPPVSIQLEYNLLCRNDVEKGFLEISRPQNTNISILAYSPLCAGILTGKYLEYTDYTTKGRMQKFPSYMKRLRGSLATYIIRELYYLSQKYYFPNLTVAALKWVYTRSFITSTIIGISDFLQLRENLYSLTDNFLFTDKLEREINALHWKFRDPIRIIQ